MQRKSTSSTGAAVCGLAAIVVSCVFLAGCFGTTPAPRRSSRPVPSIPPPPIVVAEVKPPEPPPMVRWRNQRPKLRQRPPDLPPPPVPTEKILLLAANGPLIVEFEFVD